jgi:hypothetical protein
MKAVRPCARRECNNLEKAQHFFFRLVFRYWQTHSMNHFRQLQMLERQLSKVRPRSIDRSMPPAVFILAHDTAQQGAHIVCARPVLSRGTRVRPPTAYSHAALMRTLCIRMAPSSVRGPFAQAAQWVWRRSGCGSATCGAPSWASRPS